MFICQLGMHNNVQGHRNAKVCKQTFDGSCIVAFGVVAGQAHAQAGQTLQPNHLASCTDWLMIIKANVCMEVAAQHASWPKPWPVPCKAYAKSSTAGLGSVKATPFMCWYNCLDDSFTVSQCDI